MEWLRFKLVLVKTFINKSLLSQLKTTLVDVICFPHLGRGRGRGVVVSPDITSNTLRVCFNICYSKLACKMFRSDVEGINIRKKFPVVLFQSKRLFIVLTCCLLIEVYKITPNMWTSLMTDNLSIQNRI